MAHSTASTLQFQSPSELRASAPAEPDWVLNGYLAAGNVTFIAAKPKAGKSTLLFAVADAIASHAPTFLGRAIHGGPVVILSEEGAGTLIHKLPANDDVRILTRDAAWPKPSWRDAITAGVEEALRIGAVML